MSKHDPGPWTIEEYGDDDCPSLVIHKDTQSRVCFMATPGAHGDPAVIEANARLIAAAPDLLATVKAIRDAIAMCGDQPICAWAGALNAAIAKAEQTGS